jgi:hypothetical protein
MKLFGKVIVWLHVCKFYKNGSGVGFVWNWLNPLSWIIALIIFLTNVFLFGMLETWKYRHEVGIGIDPFFEKHPEKLVWLKTMKPKE